jgi:lipoyl(octanoyl) transferase
MPTPANSDGYSMTPTLVPAIKCLGLADYAHTFEVMRAHNRASDAYTPDEIWVLEHPPVFTLGLAGKPEHVLNADDIPVVKIDRGGQVTYHGPGQLVIYLLLGMRARGYGVKELVRRIEQSVIDLLQEYGVESARREGMPGVYASPSLAKVAAIGLRVANHATYHGLSLNVNMDLEPFSRINPCGYEGLAVTQLADFGITDNVRLVGEKLVAHLKVNLYDRR